MTTIALEARAQRAGTHYDESKVPAYCLPNPLVCDDGTPVTDSATWFNRRWPELLALFENNVYGKVPPQGVGAHHEVIEESLNALDGKATRRQLRLHFSNDPDGPSADVLIYIPNDAPRPVPVFLGLNFGGNQTIHPDPAIRVTSSWVRDRPDQGTQDNAASDATRGTAASRWPVEAILARGYALATAYYGDIDPDFDDGFANGVHPLFAALGVDMKAPDAPGSIAAWAWGLSRIRDALSSQGDLDGDRVAVLGHSRLGKTALWAGASDPRFALVISNDSGCGGAALSRRVFGETVAVINTSFPHWFCDNFTRFNSNEANLPIDQHELIALIAPRPCLVLSAQDDLWADPRGEFLAVLAADPVYRLLGGDGFKFPDVNQPVNGTLGYHMRPGGHDITPDDWAVILDFADRNLKRGEQGATTPEPKAP